MYILLESQTIEVPSLWQLIEVYGPWLGLIVFLIIIILVLQFIWYNKTLNNLTQEINRLISQNRELSERFVKLIDKEARIKK